MIAPEVTKVVTGYVFIATSLDGYIAREDGDISWLEPAASDPGKVERQEDYGYAAFIENMDGIVMGRGTYEKALTFGAWPHEKPVVVLSQKLATAQVPGQLHGKVQFSSLSPHEIAAALHAQNWRRIYVDGGKVVQAFLRQNLISEMTITRIPILIGSGIPLFGFLQHDVRLKHLTTRSYLSGFVQSRYMVFKAG
jgi:dihydrofolate reductase